MTASAVVRFFFSSRRRHTRCLSDWSSDVCSSDLVGILLGLAGVLLVVAPRAAHSRAELDAILLGLLGVAGLAGGTLYFGRWGRGVPRSEERRVGKEGRSRWSGEL